MTPRSESYQFAFRVICCVVIFVGVCVSIQQFLLNRSLWLDEASLALNIINKGFVELTQPLDHGQVAPIGFLFLERISVLLFGSNEYSLRLIPLISFLCSVPLVYLFSHRLTKQKTVALVSTSIFSTTYILVRYSSEVKQYSVDVLFALIILYCAIGLDFNKRRSLYVYAVLGAASVWFSNTAIMMLFVAGVYLLCSEWYRRKNYLIFFVFALWAASFLIYYMLFIRNNPLSDTMVTYWKRAFMPHNVFSKEFYDFAYASALSVYGFLLSFGRLWFVPMLISLCGIGFMLKRRNYTVLYFLLSPIVLHLILSSFKLYPFSRRLILYSVPLIVLTFSIGVYYLFEFTNKIIGLPQLVLVIPVVVMSYPLYSKLPVEHEEIKRSLRCVEKNIGWGETIYLYYGARNAFDFYTETQIVSFGNPVIYGRSHRRENGEYDRELLDLKGGVWLLFSHVYPFSEKKNEEFYMVDFLLGNGANLIAAEKFKGSSVYHIEFPR